MEVSLEIVLGWGSDILYWLAKKLRQALKNSERFCVNWPSEFLTTEGEIPADLSVLSRATKFQNDFVRLQKSSFSKFFSWRSHESRSYAEKTRSYSFFLILNKCWSVRYLQSLVEFMFANLCISVRYNCFSFASVCNLGGKFSKFLWFGVKLRIFSLAELNACNKLFIDCVRQKILHWVNYF